MLTHDRNTPLPTNLTDRALCFAMQLGFLARRDSEVGIAYAGALLDRSLTFVEQLDREANAHPGVRAAIGGEPGEIADSSRQTILDQAVTQLTELADWHERNREALDAYGCSDKEDEARVGIDRELASMVPDLLALLVKAGVA